MEQVINRLKKVLEQDLPGQDAQYLMAPLNRERIEPEILKVNYYKPSAVMIVLCEDENDQLFIPLTQRMTYNGVHSGQVSLPGGKYDEQDGDLMVTAMRECYEEIGIKDLEILGKLTELFIPVSSFRVQPYLAACKIKNPVMINQEREVKTILRMQLSALLSNETVRHGSIEVMENLKVKTPWFDVNGHQVWGATAMILSELKELIKTTS